MKMGSGTAKPFASHFKIVLHPYSIKTCLIFIGFDMISMIKHKELTVAIEDDESAVDRLFPVYECWPFLPKAANSGERKQNLHKSLYLCILDGQ